MFLSYDVLWKVLNFLLFLRLCNERCLSFCIRPPRGQLRCVTSRGLSPVVTNLVSKHKVTKNGFRVQSLIIPHLVESHFRWCVTTYLWARGYKDRASLSSLLMCRAIELSSIWFLSYVSLFVCLLDVISWMGWCLKAWGRKGEFWYLLWFCDLMIMCEGKNWYVLMWCHLWL